MTFIYFILVLDITILVHEFGHYLFARKNGVYIYEFSIGMGPQLYKWTSKKNPTIYSIRLFPIGGYVSMAGEDLEDQNQIPKEKQMLYKSWWQRLQILAAGVIFNFLLAITLLFIVGLINGVPSSKPVIGEISSGYALEKTNLKVGDTITKINEKQVSSIDMVTLLLQVNNGKTINFEVQHENGKYEKIVAIPTKVENENKVSYLYGFKMQTNYTHGILPSIKYAFYKTGSLINQMNHIIGYLITGKLSLKSLSGPVGIYQVVGAVSKTGISNILFLIAYLCINVGYLNFIPLPAFDGGRILFLIIEKIKGKKISPEVENRIHSIGFLLLMILMVVVTYNDIIRLFS